MWSGDIGCPEYDKILYIPSAELTQNEEQGVDAVMDIIWLMADTTDEIGCVGIGIPPMEQNKQL